MWRKDAKVPTVSTHSYAQGATDIETEQSALAAAQSLTLSKEMAVDLEADSMHAFRARLCFIQVGTNEHVYLFDTLREEVSLQVLAPLFADEARTKFFHAAQGDLQFLAEAGIRLQGLFDTHRAATLLGWPKVGLADLAQQLLGVTLAKEHQQADFSQRPLPAELRAYIADDVRYLSEIGRQVRTACQMADVLEEVELDCRRLCDEAAARPDVRQLTLSLPKGKLSKEGYALGMAIAEALHRKRLAWAEAANVPIGRMLSNAALLAIAQKPPKGKKELASAKGVRGAFVREHGDEVLAMIQILTERQARGEAVWEEPAGSARNPAQRKREEVLRAFRAEKAKVRGVTPSIVLPNPLVEELSARPPRSSEELLQVPYFGSKRLALYGPELIPLLE